MELVTATIVLVYRRLTLCNLMAFLVRCIHEMSVVSECGTRRYRY
jgi:hypothetical protein